MGCCLSGANTARNGPALMLLLMTYCSGASALEIQCRLRRHCSPESAVHEPPGADQLFPGTLLQGCFRRWRTGIKAPGPPVFLPRHCRITRGVEGVTRQTDNRVVSDTAPALWPRRLRPYNSAQATDWPWYDLAFKTGPPTASRRTTYRRRVREMRLQTPSAGSTVLAPGPVGRVPCGRGTR